MFTAPPAKLNLAGGFRTLESFHWIWTRWHLSVFKDLSGL